MNNQVLSLLQMFVKLFSKTIVHNFPFDSLNTFVNSNGFSQHLRWSENARRESEHTERVSARIILQKDSLPIAREIYDHKRSGRKGTANAGAKLIV